MASDSNIHRPASVQTLASTPAPIELSAIPNKATSTGFEPPSFEADTAAVARPAAFHLSEADDHADIERQGPPRYSVEDDPYQLSSKLKSPRELDQIKANISRKRSKGCGSFSVASNYWKGNQLQGFYENQNENIERLLKPVDEHRRAAKEEQGGNQLKYKIAVRGSFAANIILAGLQVYGAAASESLSLFTTMADALFDPLSNLMLILSNRAVNSVDPRRFPSGKARIETAGNIFFCFLMCSVSFILIVLSARDLAAGSDTNTLHFHLPSVIAVVVAFCTKLALWFYCYSLRNIYSQVRILWEDHRNDLIINGFGILTSVGGSKLRWWIDPMGAILLSCLISVLWLKTAYQEFQLLIGVSADTQMLQHITYISMTHSPMISAIDTVRAYHSGPRIIVEVDIVMDPNETLQATHDVAEELQTKLESLPDVERAYVHVDYETSHKPEHFLKKEL
ncbi:hypothetical protein L228DRAFT_241445 [Xylona heveae TC161]|uniref:Uncharacterized protein n=1 Tax=Xylona heveae (strain CBS 132557 / TC161) TaxID=1328760 RepID=A0A164ZY90_XYLHT|nr:hypothetical protein L228DRAFT_241445 [Xylona heveae TC161]KZF19692.1 hypothetical protein L228DRAFT_241445 [Xylona heveae TC161]